MIKTKVNEFVDYVMSFYGDADAIYPMNITRVDVLEALAIRLMPDNNMLNEHGRSFNTIPFEGDSFDREYVRDIMLEVKK